MGLGPNLTLETAINPDFGQVEADPAEVNLTAFETRFPEKRPFFLEGAQLFNIGHPNFYYSRRIGARPIGRGRWRLRGLSRGQLDHGRRQADRAPAIEDVARFHRRRDRRRRCARRECGDSLERRDVEVAPHAYHSSAACCRSSAPMPRPPASSSTTCIAMSRRGARSAISIRETRCAAAGNTLLRFKGGTYEFRASGGGSFLNGERESRRAVAALELALCAAPGSSSTRRSIRR